MFYTTLKKGEKQQKILECTVFLNFSKSNLQVSKVPDSKVSQWLLSGTGNISCFKPTKFFTNVGFSRGLAAGGRGTNTLHL